MITSHKRKRITIKDVAQAAGVSTQTVSRVMNKFSYVSNVTRQRVETVVQELGYTPSTLARSLSQQRSYTLGIVTYGLEHIGPSRTLNGVADQADRLGYMLLMKELDKFSTDRIEDVVYSLLAQQVDGIIWIAPEIGDSHAWVEERMATLPVPVLFLSARPRKDILGIATDNFLGAQMAVRHLLDCGRTHVGHISGPLTWWEADERKRGWRETLTAAGFEVLEQHCAEGNWSSSSGEKAFIRLLDSFPDMDAVFVSNDQMALSVLRESCRRGIKVPAQLAVVGFDNIPESAYFYPSLTTVYQDLQLLGEQAVQSIVSTIQARQENQPVFVQAKFVPPALIIRESSICF